MGSLSIEPAESQFAFGSAGVGDAGVAQGRISRCAIPGRLSFLKFAIAALLAFVSATGAFISAAYAADTLWIRFSGQNVNEAVRSGQSVTFSTTLIKSDGTIIEGVPATWSVVSGPVTVNPSSGLVTAGAVSVDTQATISASFTDAVLTGGATLTDSRAVTVQASQDYWTGGRTPGQGGDTRGFVTVGTDVLVNVYGGGIFRSSDGVTWKRSDFGIPFRNSAFVRNLTGVPGITTQLLAAVEGRGIYRSIDGGASWTSSNTGMGCNFPRGFSARSSTNTIYVASECGLYKSIDGGNTWSATGFTQSVQGVSAFSGSDTVWVTTLGNGLYRSLDAGATWTQMNNGLSGPNGLHAYAFRSFSGGVLFTMIEGSGIFQSTNSGTSWFPANSGLPAISTYSFQGGNIASEPDGYLYIAVEGYGIYRGTTGATTSNPVAWSAWGNTATQLPLRQRPPDLINGIYHVASGQGVYKSSDNGVTWTKYSAGLPGGFAHVSATDPTNTSIVYATADTVYKSTDGGATWVKSATGITSAHSGLRGRNGSIVRRSDGALYVGTANGGIFKSVDGAANWTPVNNGLPAIVGQGVAVRGGLSSAPQTLFALYGEDPRGVYRTIDGGANWTNISGDLLGNALYAYAIAVDSRTGDLYVGTEAGLYKSVNGGTNWTAVPSATTPVNHVRVDDVPNPSDVYFSTYFNNSSNAAQATSGLYRSSGGAAPTQLLTNRLVRNFRALRPGGQLTLYVSSWNNVETEAGVFKSTNGGATWQSIKSGLDHRYVNSFDAVGEQLMHASARGRGVYTFSGSVDAALVGVQAALDNFRNIVNTQGASLEYTHFYPGSYDAGFLDNGRNSTQDAQTLASDVRGLTITSATIIKVNSYDAVNGIIDVAVQLVTSEGTFVLDNTLNDNDGLVFKHQGGGVYKIYGNQQLARLQAKFETENRQTGQTCPSGCDGAYYFTQFQADAPAGTVTAVTVNGPGYPGSSLVFNGTDSESIQASPPPATPLTFNRDRYTLMPPQSPTLNFPPPGSQYTFTITPTTGPQQQVTRTVTPWTTETISITSPTSHALAAANLGGPLTINWTLPTTFTVREIFIYVNTSSTAGTCNGALQIENIPPNATSYTINPMPTQCLGQPIADGAQTYPVQVNVGVTGTNGEATRVWYAFGNSVCTGNSGPTNLIATGVVQTQVQLQWNGACMPTTIANYGVYRGTTPGGPYTLIGNPVNPNTSTVFFNDTTVSPSTTYYYVVNATDVAANVSAYSNELAVTTPSCSGDCISPSIPTNVVATAVNSNQVNLTWTASTDNVGVTRYQIGRNGSYINTNAPATTSYSDMTALPGTTYTYFVSACDAAGNCSVGSNVSTVTTPTSTGTGAALYTRFGAQNVSNSVRQGQTAQYRAVLVKADGTILDSVTASWSITAGPATVDSNGLVTGGAVSVNTPATLVASFTDATLTGGVTLTSTRTLTIQASQDHWTGGTTPGQGGEVFSINSVGTGTDILAGIFGGGVRRTSDGVNWSQSGYGIPFFGSARVRALRTVPNTSNMQVLAAVEGSGIYRSSNGGASWTASNTGIGCNFPRGFGARTSTNTMYVAVNCSPGLYKSLDGGNTWTSTTLTQPVRSVVAFSNSDTVWAVTFGNGLYRSTDAGATWAAVNNGLPTNLQVYAFDSRGNVTLAQVEGAGIYRSPGGTGGDWVAQNSGLPASYGFQGGIGYQTSDGYFYVSVEGYGIYRGTTGANTSDPVTWLPWGSTASQLPLRSRTPALISGSYYVGSAQGVFKSSDSGATWTKTSTGLPGGFVRTSVTDPTNTNILYATADTVYKSTDGGATWVKSASGITSAHAGLRGSNGTVIRRSDGTLYVGTANGGIFKSTNGAASWFPVNNGLPAILGQGVNIRGGLTSAPQTMYALYGEDPLGVYRSVDGGANWINISGDLSGNALYVNTLNTDPATGNLYIGTDGGLYKSVNGGTNWTPLYTAHSVGTVGIDTGVSPSDVYFSTFVNNSFNAPQADSGLYRSVGGTAAPTQLLSGHLVQNFRALRPGGALTFYLAAWTGANNGVMRSTDGGATWQTINSGLNHSFVSAFDPVNEQIMHVSTRGGGVYTFVSAVDGTPPTVPGSFTATAVSSSQINLGWTASNDVVGVAAYHVFRGGVQIATLNSATLTYNDTGLAASTLYNYGVRACDAAGNCSAQATTSATTQAAGDTTPPTVPGNFTATPISSSQINLSWTASTDNVAVIGYLIYSNGVFRATVPASTTSFSDTGLAASTLYGYALYACDAAGNCSTPQAGASATTPAAGSANFAPLLRRGWNLLGNSLELTLNVVTLFGSPGAPVTDVTTYVNSIWKWNATLGIWQFYAPNLTAQQNQDYADLNGFEVLANIEPGLGYWVNLKNSAPAGGVTLTTQSGVPVIFDATDPIGGTPAKIAGRNLVTGWQLVAIADPDTPSTFNEALSGTTPQPTVVKLSFQSLWAWDALLGTWYFYAPQLHKDGVAQDVGLTLVKQYADNNGFLHFEDYGKTLGIGTGFWIRK